MALGLMAGLRDAGLAVPRDVSVVGIDGLFLAALSNPMLTTVQLPVPRDGAGDGRARDPAHADDRRRRASRGLFTPTLLVERESVGRRRRGHAQAQR